MERIDITPDLTFSRLVYGMWRLGDDADTSDAHIRAKLDAALRRALPRWTMQTSMADYTVEGLFGNVLKATPSLRDRSRSSQMRYRRPRRSPFGRARQILRHERRAHHDLCRDLAEGTRH